MEVEEKQFIITEKWLEDIRACKAGLRAFKKHFPNGGEALEVLKRCGELDYTEFGEWLVDSLPLTYPPLVLNNLIGNLFYPGDIHIKGDLFTQGRIYIKGSLKVGGKLTVNKYGMIYTDKNCINAGEINLSENAYIYPNIKANSIRMRGFTTIGGEVTADNINLSGHAEIKRNVIAKVINLKGGFIGGNVDADEIINDGGIIKRNVNTIKIQNINGGRVDGKITYKC